MSEQNRSALSVHINKINALFLPSFFKIILLYAKIYSNRIEITQLIGGRTISKSAKKNFSNTSLILANFANAELLFREIVNEFVPQIWFFSNPFIVLIQQLEGFENHLSEFERKSLIDLAEFAGAKKVIIVEHSDQLSIDAALTKLKS